ncbi:hypothetical protein B0H13DRAFT_2383527 [Mycena leptocephala]|nr:hypothetical protein B0H13DRAFT_2383527 [Mycena leptocephala]
MKFTLFVTFSFAASSLATSIFPPAGTKIIDVASYKAAANGTISLANDDRRDGLQKRDAGNVYLCVAANWQEYCVYITDAGPGECVNLADDLNDQVSSFGPDPNQYCYAFRNYDCDIINDGIGPIRSPGLSDLSQPISFGEGGGVSSFNDVMSSYA